MIAYKKYKQVCFYGNGIDYVGITWSNQMVFLTKEEAAYISNSWHDSFKQQNDTSKL